ncbi:hypothetical protein A2693_04565 [Candidatus Curtissbacteria bacterium RIFCSPHIGHO2_01_FULL_40_12]|uniref:Glycosyltransferase 2-like domain-containing protein n=1 Tax=Candidatus Curtissbacteria bacterium RIFCSPHIGHO2_01_FULL_40_12 TaxID=1797710 RepID=A0A1F5GA28_9BACT|nr:MAG: hypothetical protein A2693_04565 [Candidatus Curtissbacteria bacterium RIFCSPHIGHO2_01_FULL_40_12]
MSISALILTKNEEEMIEDCLRQLDFVDEIIVLDTGSKDKTVDLAKKYTKSVFQTSDSDFDKNRTLLAKTAKSDWLLYVDADERLTKELKTEIKQVINKSDCSAFHFPRKNIILGKWLRHGGWWPDYVPRLFKKAKLKQWSGRVHESPNIEGDFGYLKNPLLHYTARNLGEMLAKSIVWGQIEAELYNTHQMSKVTVFKITKAMTWEFIKRFVIKRGFLDGFVGFIEALYQATHRAIIFTYLWEIQNDVNQKYKRFNA